MNKLRILILFIAILSYIYTVPNANAQWHSHKNHDGKHGDGKHHHTFVDENNDGICDNIVDEDNDGLCDFHLKDGNGKDGHHGNGGMMGGMHSGMEIMNDCFELYQNEPNPFHDFTDINMKVLREEYFEIRVFDFQGKEVKVIYRGTLSKGFQSFKYIPEDALEGKYLYQVNGGGFVESGKMINIE